MQVIEKFGRRWGSKLHPLTSKSHLWKALPAVTTSQSLEMLESDSRTFPPAGRNLTERQ
jgi:hypothetical protein